MVETIIERLPQRNFVSSLDFVEKPVNPCDRLALVIASQNYYLSRVSDLESEEETNYFTTLLTSVDVVAHEQVSGVFGNYVVLLFGLVFVSHFFEHVQQVGVLPVDVAEDFYRSLELYK